MPRPPQAWTDHELHRDAELARRRFVADRLSALRRDQAVYESGVETHAKATLELLSRTGDLHKLDSSALRERRALDTARYVTVPPISLDDLDTLTDGAFGLWIGQRTERGAKPTEQAFRAAAKIIRDRIDRERAPWLAHRRAPTAAERLAFARVTASIRALGEVQTTRRMESSARQEEAARIAAERAGYSAVAPLSTLDDPINQMPPASYSTASRRLVDTNMDVPVRLKSDHGRVSCFSRSKRRFRTRPSTRANVCSKCCVNASAGTRAGSSTASAPQPFSPGCSTCVVCERRRMPASSSSGSIG